MRPEDKERWLEFVGEEIGKAEAAVFTSKKEVGQATETSNTREDPTFVWDAQGRVNRANGQLSGLRAFQTELQQAGVTDKVGSGAQLRILVDGSEEQLLVMKTRIDLPAIRVITLDTPLVKAIHGQKCGFRGLFEVPQGVRQVEILEIH